MNVDIITYAITWAIIIVVHEYGHYLGFRYYKYKPKIKVRMIGIITVGENVQVMTIKQSVIILYAGIVAGLIPTLLFFGKTPLNVMFYFLLSMVDISQIMIISCLPKIQRKMSWLEYHKSQVEKLEQA
jgi:hypothetical protein